MTTMKYKTLNGLVSKTRQYSLYSFVSGRICHIKKGWVNVKLSEELRKEIKNKFCEILGNVNLDNLNNNCGLFERLTINKRLRVDYIAGQDYPSEIRNLKRLVRKEVL
jgi:hypothetical protein